MTFFDLLFFFFSNGRNNNQTTTNNTDRNLALRITKNKISGKIFIDETEMTHLL